MRGKLIHEELSRAIIGAAMAVLNELKPGLDEKLYERALVIALLELGHSVDQQKRFFAKLQWKRIAHTGRNGGVEKLGTDVR